MLSIGGIAAVISTALVAGVVLLLIFVVARGAGMAGDETARAAVALKATVAEAVYAAAELRCYGIDRQLRARIDGILGGADDGPDENAGSIVGRTLELLQFLPHPLPFGSIAVVRAPSDTGKTSLFETLVGLRSAKRGMARLGGIYLVWLPGGHLRLNFALAPQDAMLLSATVADEDADDGRLWSALRDADLDRRCRRCRTGWTAGSARMGNVSRAASAAACRSPARSFPAHPGCCWMNREKASNLTTEAACRRGFAPACSAPGKARSSCVTMARNGRSRQARMRRWMPGRHDVVRPTSPSCARALSR